MGNINQATFLIVTTKKKVCKKNVKNDKITELPEHRLRIILVTPYKKRGLTRQNKDNNENISAPIQPARFPDIGDFSDPSGVL